MESKPVILITGTQVSPEVEEEVNKWFDEVHGPRLLQSGVKRTNRYKLISGGGKEYPRYVGIYEFENRQAFEKWNSDPTLFNALRTLRRQKFSDEAFNVIWYAAYELASKTKGEFNTARTSDASPLA